MADQKEKHPVYWAAVAGFLLLLAFGVLLLIAALGGYVSWTLPEAVTLS